MWSVCLFYLFLVGHAAIRLQHCGQFFGLKNELYAATASIVVAIS